MEFFQPIISVIFNLKIARIYFFVFKTCAKVKKTVETTYGSLCMFLHRPTLKSKVHPASHFARITKKKHKTCAYLAGPQVDRLRGINLPTQKHKSHANPNDYIK